MSVNSKVVLITGCTTGGIGYHIADEFGKNGCIVYATSRRVETMDFTNPQVRTLAMDVTSDESVQSTIEEIVKREGKIDIVVNNAGIWVVAPLVDHTVEQAKTIFDTNVLSFLRTTQAVLPHMAARKKGLIINIGSLDGQIATPFSGFYDASKAALHSLTDVLAMEARPLGVDVMLIAPGTVSSNIIDNTANNSRLPANSLYKPYEQKVLDRLYFATTMPGTWTSERFAVETVKRALKPNPPSYWSAGGASWKMYLLRWLPRWLVLSILWKSLGAN